MTDEDLENKCMQEHYTKAEHSRVLHMCMGLFTNEVTITQVRCLLQPQVMYTCV